MKTLGLFLAAGSLLPAASAHAQPADADELKSEIVDQAVSDRFNVIGSVLANYTDDIKYLNSTQPLVPDAAQPSYWLVNARLGIKTADESYQLAVFADNLFNQAYFASGNSGPLGRLMRWGQPRVAGVEFRVRFD